MGGTIMTFTELVKTEFPDSTKEVATDYGRTLRNNMLAASDWTQANDAPFTDAQKYAWADYRQQLRDAPEQPNWPDVQIPVKPS